MAKAIYDVSVPNIYEVEKALGDAKDKAPRAMKNAVNQTATRAKNMMIRQAKLRYAVSTAGRRHLNQLKLRNRATIQNPTAEIFIKSRRNDLADFKTNPTEPHMGGNWVHSPEFHTGKVLKKSPMDNLTGGQTLIGPGSKGFLVRFESGHVGMVQACKESEADTVEEQKRDYRISLHHVCAVCKFHAQYRMAGRSRAGKRDHLAGSLAARG